MKLQLDFDEDGKELLDRLLMLTGCKTYKELFNNSLTLLDWAIQQRMKGWHIAVVDDNDQKFRRVLMPVIEAAARKSIAQQEMAEASA